MNLEKLLEEAVNSPEKRVEFINALLNSTVFVIGGSTDQTDEEGTVTPMINLFTVRNKDDNNTVPFFSTIEKLEEFASKIANGKPPFLEFNCMEFFKLVSAHDSGAVFNPNANCCKEFFAEEIKDICNSVTKTTVEANPKQEDKVLISIPKVFPDSIADALTKFFSSRLDVNRAFVFDITYPNQKPHLLFIIDCEYDREELYDKVQEITEGFLVEDDDIIDIISAKEKMCEELVKSQPPFYSKRKIVMS